MNSNPSEHRKACAKKRGCLFSHAVTRAATAATIILTLALGSCSSPDTRRSYRNADDALADYSAFCASLHKKASASTEELVKAVNEWRELDDSVSVALAHDTISAHNESYFALHDSITEKMMTLVDSRKRELKDYLDVVYGVRNVKMDSANARFMESIHRFYAAMDSVPTYRLDKASTVKAYEKVLDDAARKGFHTRQDLFNFLREEDRAFRSFLCHLPSLGNVPLVKVRDMTKELMDEMIELAQEERPLFSADEIVVLLSMRNNRRLMQNALQCVNDIRAGKVGRGDQSTAYTWMLLQPWVSFDACSYATMSNAQWKTMYLLAAEAPKALRQLKGSEFPIKMDDLPSLLIKTYLSTL